MNSQEIQPTDTLRYAILASGSSGNATYIETPKQRLLVDAGLSGKKIEELMGQINRSMDDVDAILVTHEHSDHIKGVGVLSRRYNLPIYANQLTWSKMQDAIGRIDPDHKHYLETGELVTLGDLDIQSFPVSHDAIAPQFYGFQRGGKQFAMLTDTGYVSDELRGLLHNCSAYLIESNHEIEMLRYGPYPWSLKQRILGDQGHLSNEDGALALIDLIGDQTQSIYLGHLSRDNNTKELAKTSVTQILQSYDFAVNEDFALYLSDPDTAGPLHEL